MENKTIICKSEHYSRNGYLTVVETLNDRINETIKEEENNGWFLVQLGNIEIVSDDIESNTYGYCILWLARGELAEALFRRNHRT